MRQPIKAMINAVLKPLGVRVVNTEWGPRGFLTTFGKLRAFGYSPKVIYDVGASDGSWTRGLKRIFPVANYVLFEPLQQHARQLEQLVANTKGIAFCPCALGAKDDKLDLYVHEGQSSFFRSSQWLGPTYPVRVRSIDSLVQNNEYPAPDLIKADIQGFEMEMLKGAAKCLKHCSFIFLEVSWIQLYQNSPTAGEVIGWLAERGFHVFDISSYATRPLDKRLTQSYVCFAHIKTGLFDDSRWCEQSR